ncbi:S8 family serine peptidase [Cohnella silvisoli]|uniref:S8 family serine peptidase n=1 Tax=Cohnella silvisoli TaxID=2873699 RepID=A0ABV1KYQ1_9BACL|nr:S8 family serine peptidase [Cohnella silvisoli]MCD9024089.1 S8 family serine peptidase [Cohnella silvisoli]
MSRTLRLIANISLFMLLFTTLFFDYSALAAQNPQAAKAAPRHKTELIVKYKSGAKSQNINAAIKTKLKLEKLESKHKSKKNRVEVLQIADGDNLDQTIAELKKDPNVEYAQPNYLLYASELPQDARFEEQWGLLNNGQNIGFQAGSAGVDIDAVNAWNVTTGSSSVLVGVLDTGIDMTHPDLAANIYTHTAEIPDNGIDDDGNGYIDDVHGYDFANEDATVFDSSSDDKHGTHVAGIIAAEANDVGVRGVAPGVSLLPLKFMTGGAGYTSDAIEAIEYAQSMGVSILNASFGGPESNPALQEALAQSGMLIVAAAGNHGGNVDTSPVYPASYQLTNLLSVTAVDNQGKLAAFSGYGSTVDVAAPGVGIISTIPGGGYAYLSGTSMAAPFVTGIAALIKSQYPDLTGAQIAERIKGTVTFASNLTGKVATEGWVNAASALTGQVTAPPVKPKSPTDEPSKPGNGGMVVSLAAEVSPALLEQIHYGEEGVNVATGNYGKSVTDLSVSSPGFIVNISRTYNSKDDRTTSSMGRGWTFGFEGSVKDDTTSPNSLKVVKLPSGGAQVFVKNPDGSYTANDSHSTLVKLPDNTHVLTTKDQYTYGFNVAGFLTWMQDRNGNRVNIETDAQGKTRKITDTVGRIFTVGYNASGYLTSVTDPIGRVVTYGYDAQNRLNQVTDPTNQIIAKYTYDSSNYLTGVQDGANTVLETNTYNHAAGTDQHKVMKTANAYGNAFLYTYDNLARQTTIKDLAGLTTIKWYDTAGYVVKSQDPEGRLTIADYFLDANSYNKFGEEKNIFDRNGNKTTYERDSNGNITKQINPDYTFKEYAYDTKNNLILEKDELGKRTEYIYDANKIRLLQKVQPQSGTDVYSEGANTDDYAITTYQYFSDAESARLGYRAKGLLQTETDPEGGTVSYTYDSEGNKQTVTDAAGDVTTFAYNGIGWLTGQTSPAGYQTEYVYDKAGRLVRTMQEGGETSFSAYDTMGRLVQSISPNVYKPEEDGLNDVVPTNVYKNNSVGVRLVYETNGLLKSKTDALGNVTSYTYDGYGNLASETKPNGSVYLYQYDVMNRLKKTMFKTNNENVPVTLDTTSYAVLAGGSSQKKQTVYFSDADTAITTWTYDSNGREASVIRADGTSVSTDYFANGTIKSTKDARGNSTYYRYDGLNRLTGSWSPLDGGKYSYKGIAYDRTGRKTMEQTGKDAVSLYSIPSGDRVMWSKTSYTTDGLVAQTFTSAGGRTAFQYDEEGRVVREDVFTSAEESLINEYTYDYRSKPTEKKQHVRNGDLAGNDFTDDSDTILLTSYAYDAEGNLLNQTTPDGIVTSMTYDLLGRVLKTKTEGVDENGLPTEITAFSTYDWAGKTLTNTDPKGNLTSFAYDQRGNLLNQTDALGGVTAYTYDRAGRKTIQVSPQNFDANKSLTDLSRTTYVYDKMGRVQLEKETFTEKKVNPTTYAWVDTPTELVTKAYLYDANGNVIKELDGEGYLAGTGASNLARIQSGYGTETTYNAANLPVTQRDAVSVERGLKWTTKCLYDGAGRQVGVINAKGVVSGTKYDDASRVVGQTVRASLNAPEKVLKTSTYDLAGRVISETDGNGNTATFMYNAFSQTRTTFEPGDDSIEAYTTTNQYDVTGHLVKTEDSLGVTNLSVYDAQGKEISHTEQMKDGSQAITTSVRYDKNGNARFVTDGNGNVTENLYDALNRLIETKASVTDVSGTKTTHSTTFGYDKNGNKQWEQNWLGNRQTFTYDERNRLSSTTDAANVVVQKLQYNASDVQTSVYDALNRQTTYTFDHNNRQLSVTDAEGHTTSQSYNDVGQKGSQTDGLGHSTQYSYDELGKLASVINALGETTAYTYDLNGNTLTQKDGRGFVTSFEYNLANKLTKRIDHGGRSGKAGSFLYNQAKVESYSYMGSGQMKTKIDRNGNTTAYVYDAHDRLLSQTVTGVGLVPKDNQIFYTYDNNGNQLSMKDGTGLTNRTYDELNRVITKSVPGMGTSTFLLDQTAGLTAGFVSEVTTDVKGNVTTKIYDKTNRLSEVKDGASVQASYLYYADGSQQQVTYASGAKEVYTYYKNNLLLSLNNYQGTTLLDTYSYIYDNANNQKSKTETVNGVSKGTTLYTYDALNRLETITEPSGKKTEYTFDPSGNRLSEKTTQDAAITLISYGVNEQNHLYATAEVKSTGETQQTNFYYDNNGNLINKTSEFRKKIDPANPPTPTFGLFIYGQSNPNPRISDVLDGVARYEYDGFNQLVKVGTGNSGAIYQYNGDGLRVKKTADGVTTSYLYEYDKAVLETDGKGKQAARNLYGLNLISRTMGTDSYFYLYNGHADVTALISPTGILAASYEYDAFGNITNKTGTVNNPIRYAGYQYDEESKFYYLNARYYDPKLARFLTEDTYRGQANDPLSLNLYTYVANEPIKYVDPTGHLIQGMNGASITKPKTTSGSTIKAGDSGDKVKAVQEMLVKAGYNIATDGNFGPKTQAAVLNFQKSQGIKTDGIVGNQTINVLGASNSTKNAPDSIKEAVISNAKKSLTGNISSDTILMSSGQFQQALQQVESTKKQAGTDRYVTTTVTENKVVITGTATTPKPVQPEPVKSTSSITKNSSDNDVDMTQWVEQMFGKPKKSSAKKILEFAEETSGYSALKTLGDPKSTQLDVYVAIASIAPIPGPDIKITKEKVGQSKGTFYHVTSKESAQQIMESQMLGRLNNQWESRVFAWTEQPTKSQAKAAGIGSRTESVIEFKTNASFEPDVGIVNPKIKNITVQTTDTQGVPINIFDTKEVGFKKRWWEFWK